MIGAIGPDKFGSGFKREGYFSFKDQPAILVLFAYDIGGNLIHAGIVSCICDGAMERIFDSGLSFLLFNL